MKIVNVFHFPVYLTVFWMLLEGSVGCGPRPDQKGKFSKPAQAPTEQQAAPLAPSSPASVLRPVVLPSKEQDWTLPAEEGGEGDVVAEGNVIVFNQVIPFAAPGMNMQGVGDPPNKGVEDSSKNRPKFLVWDENALGSPIVNAYYLYEKRDVHNQKTGNAERKNAFQDKASGRWFIPLELPFGGMIQNADPTEMQWLTLELHLADVTVINVRVGLRILGPLPKVAFQEMPLDSRPSSAESFITSVREKGWVVARESYTNPSARHLHLWVKRGEEKLFFTTNLVLNTFERGEIINKGRDLEVHEKNKFFHSQVGLQVRQLEVFHGERKIQATVDLKPGEWVPVSLGPHETVTLSWRALPPSGVQRCVLPSPRELTFPWTEERAVRTGTGRNLEVHTEYVSHSTTRTARWSMVGAKVGGDFKRSVLFSDPYVSLEDLGAFSSDRVAALLSESEKSVEEGSGVFLNGAEPFSCQGIF